MAGTENHRRPRMPVGRLIWPSKKEGSAKVLPVGMPFRRFQANDTRLAFSGKRSDYNRWGAFGMRPALSQAAPRCPGLVDKRKCNAQQKASGFRWSGPPRSWKNNQGLTIYQ